jgi:CsoR family transcriptional regulator, copper-sensing transcriptional repressor
MAGTAEKPARKNGAGMRAGAAPARGTANHRHEDGAEAARCGCGVSAEAAAEGRKAVGVDADAKERNLKRLRRIEGQVRGLQKMVEDDRYCADIMTQISSVHEALRAVGRELMRNHLKHCVTAASHAGGEEATAAYDELVDMMYKHSR